MFRYLVAHLPAFRLERCGWSASQPAALVAEEKSAWRVQCATPAALRAGVRRGMTAAEARAVLPTLQVESLQAEDEARDLDDLATQLLRVSPSVATLPPDGLLAEISRTVRVGAGADGAALAGAERALLERMRIRLEQLGHQVVVVVADDPATALACAAWGRRSRVVPPGQGQGALSGLPLAALDLPPREHDLLLGLGLRTVGDFAALPAASVVELTSDSEYVVKGITQWLPGWKRRGWKEVKNRDLWERLDAARTPREVTWRWVRGHSGDPHNERVDRLAVAEAERQKRARA